MSGSTSNGHTLTATLSVAPGPSASYLGIRYSTATISLSTYSAGVLQGTSEVNLWFDQRGRQQFVAMSQEGACAWTDTSAPMPTNAALRQVGPYVQASRYVGCAVPSDVNYTYTQKAGSVTESWEYSEFGGRPFVCIDVSDTGQLATATTQYCFEVADSAGTLGSHFRLTAKDLDGITTTLAN